MELKNLSQTTSLTLDTRALTNGSVFVAIKGAKQDGRHFLSQAKAQGAIAVICEANGLDEIAIPADFDLPLIKVTDLKGKLPEIATRFYPKATALPMIGVTGTNGKTTIAYLLAQALSREQKPWAFLGTIGMGAWNNLQPATLTTPDILTCYQQIDSFAKYYQGGVMEVSSHALCQERVKGLYFTSAHFSNLTQDHLDYHQTMAAYFAAKNQLFSWPTLKHVVLNADCPYAAKITHTVPALRYSTLTTDADIYVKDIIYSQQGINARVITPWGQGELTSPLLGAFNCANILAVLAELGLSGMPLTQALTIIKSLAPPPGRMQVFKVPYRPTVVVDFAHTPDALLQALKVVKHHTQGKIYCVFGCGGERDVNKRSQMGTIAEQYADEIILTDDNPRNENAQQIIMQIMAGMSLLAQKNVRVEHNRKQAIAFAVAHAAPEDIILLAGKGHEATQVIGKQQIPFSDIEQVKNILKDNAC